MLLEVFRLSNFMNSWMQMGADILVQQEQLWISPKDQWCTHPTAMGSCCKLAIPAPKILLPYHKETETVREMQCNTDKKLRSWHTEHKSGSVQYVMGTRGKLKGGRQKEALQ